MTLTIELPPQQEQILRAKAARLGIPVERYALDMLLRDAKEIESRSEQIEARLSAFNKLVNRVHSGPDRRAEAGLAPLNLSGSRADIYGYTEREEDIIDGD